MLDAAWDARHPLLRHRAALRARACPSAGSARSSPPSRAPSTCVSTKVGRLLRPSPETADRLDDANQFAVPASLRAGLGLLAPTASGASLEESLRAARPRPGRRPLPARPRRATDLAADLDDRRAGARRAARRGAGRARSASARSRSRRCSPPRAPARSTCSWWPAATRCSSSRRPPSCCRRAAAPGIGDRRAGGLQLRAAGHRRPRPGARYEYGAVPRRAARAGAAARGGLRAARGGAAGGGAAVPAARAGGAVASWWAAATPEQVRENARPDARSRSRRRCGTTSRPRG